MTTIAPCPYDEKLKNRYRGRVWRIDSDGTEVVALVYGKTLEIMRQRKRRIAEAIRKDEEVEQA